jgi:RNA polymerase sigma-70 factor (ECF subfamily)
VDSIDFDTFYAATHRRIVSHVYAMAGSSLSEAEGCVQEAYAQAWQQWGRIAGDVGNPEAWVRTVAVRRALSPWRKAVTRLKARRRGRRRADEVPGMDPEHIAVIAALRRIPADQRMAIVLCHHAGLSIEEIAAETGVAPGTVETRLSRGRKALTPLLTEFADSPDRRPRTPQFTNQPQLSGRGI